MSEEQQLVKAVKQPIVAGERGVNLASMEDMYRFAVAMVNSGTFKDLPSPEVALMKLQAGAELGLTPVWSLTNIFVVNGKPTVYGDALIGIVRGHKDCLDVIETYEGTGDDMVCTCEVRRRDCVPTVRKFSVADAKRAGLWGKSGPWTMYSTRMLQMRARSFALRDAFADALRGIQCREEVQDVPKQAQVREIASVGLKFADETEAK